MVILGVTDVPSPSAALIVDDEVVASVSGEQLGRPESDEPVPWHVVDAALAAAGLTPDQVDVVAFAGRFSPPLALRQRPRLRRFVSRAFSPLLDVQVLWQAVLRHSGLGAYAADVAAEWLESRFTAHGFRMNRLLTVDAHKAVAEAAYRFQPHDTALVLSLQPLGDGVAFSVHLGRGAQLDRLWFQNGLESVHTHLARMLAALGLADDDLAGLGSLAARGSVDADLRRALAVELHAEGRRLSRRIPFSASTPYDATLRRIAEVDRADAAASVHANLVETVTTLVRRHVRERGVGTVALAGDVFDDPRLVAAIAETKGVERVLVLPRPGRDALALGAAASQAGIAPARRELHLGPRVDGEAAAKALEAAGLGAVRKASLVDLLCRGEAVVRFRDRPGPGRHGLGERAVLVRADDLYAIRRVREALGLPEHVDPMVIAVPTPNEGGLQAVSALGGPLSVGMAAPRVDETWVRRYGASVAPDGRMHLLRAEEATHPGIHQLVKAVLRQSGCGALAAFPLVQGADGTLVSDPQGVVELFRRGRFAALQLGSYYVEREGAA